MNLKSLVIVVSLFTSLPGAVALADFSQGDCGCTGSTYDELQKCIKDCKGHATMTVDDGKGNRITISNGDECSPACKTTTEWCDKSQTPPKCAPSE